MIAEWSTALPLTASCHLPLASSNPGRFCEKVASDLGLGGGFPMLLRLFW